MLLWKFKNEMIYKEYVSTTLTNITNNFTIMFKQQTQLKREGKGKWEEIKRMGPIIE